MKDACAYNPCYATLTTDAPDYPYCTRKCFEADIAMALKIDHSKHLHHVAASLGDLGKYFSDEVSGGSSCDVHKKICELRDDAETRIKNIETFGPAKLIQTKEYFQARADVLNDLLNILSPKATCSCR